MPRIVLKLRPRIFLQLILIPLDITQSHRTFQEHDSNIRRKFDHPHSSHDFYQLNFIDHCTKFGISPEPNHCQFIRNSYRNKLWKWKWTWKRNRNRHKHTVSAKQTNIQKCAKNKLSGNQYSHLGSMHNYDIIRHRVIIYCSTYSLQRLFLENQNFASPASHLPLSECLFTSLCRI